MGRVFATHVGGAKGKRIHNITITNHSEEISMLYKKANYHMNARTMCIKSPDLCGDLSVLGQPAGLSISIL